MTPEYLSCAKTTLPVQTNMIFIDLEAAGLRNAWLAEEAQKRGVRFGFFGRLVVHHQICSEAVASLKEAVEAVVKKKAVGGYVNDVTEDPPMYGRMKQSNRQNPLVDNAP